MVVKKNQHGRMGQLITQLRWKWGVGDFNSEDRSRNFYVVSTVSEAEKLIQHCNGATVDTLLAGWFSTRNMMLQSCIIWKQRMCSSLE